MMKKLKGMFHFSESMGASLGLAVIVLLLLGFGLRARAAGSLPEDVLRTSWSDPRIGMHAEALKIVHEARSVNPLIKSEIRLERGQVAQDELKIGVRVYPKGPSEINTSGEFQKAMERNEQVAASSTLSQLLASRYELLARVALLKSKKEIFGELSLLSRKAGQALSYAAQKDRAEIKSFLKNKADVDKLQLKVADTERDIVNLQAELKELSLSKLEQFQLEDLADIADIQARFDQAPEIPKEALSSKVAKVDLEQVRAGFAYDRAREEKWLDHLEFSVKQDKKEKVYGVGVAINLPFGGAPDLGRVEKETRILRDAIKLHNTVTESERIYKNTFGELRTLFDLHKLMSQAAGRMSTDQMRKASRAIAPTDPLLALELQRGWYESREQVLDLEYRIRSLYVVYLQEAGVLAEQPQLNHLSKSSRRII